MDQFNLKELKLLKEIFECNVDVKNLGEGDFEDTLRNLYNKISNMVENN